MPIMWKLSGHWISPWAAWISTPCSATLWRRSTNYRKLVLGSVPISPAVLNPFWPNWKSPFAAVSTRQRPTAWCRVTAPKTVKHPCQPALACQIGRARHLYYPFHHLRIRRPQRDPFQVPQLQRHHLLPGEHLPKSTTCRYGHRTEIGRASCRERV